jgi:hypothetical protein
MQSSRVVFPAPDGPKRIVIPGTTETERLISKSRPAPEKCFPSRTDSASCDVRSTDDAAVLVLIWGGLFPWPYRPYFSVHTIHEREHGEGNPQQDKRGLIGSSIVEGLNLVVDVDGNRPRNSRDVSAHH